MYVRFSKGNTLVYQFILFRFRVLENTRECVTAFPCLFCILLLPLRLLRLRVNMLDRVMFMVLIMARPGEKGKDVERHAFF
jgi:hypothetical protein